MAFFFNMTNKFNKTLIPPKLLTLALFWLLNWLFFSKVYQVIYDCHFMLNSKIPFIVFGQVWFLRCAWILHKCRICKVVHISTQLWSKQSCQKKNTTWGEGGLFMEHLTVHIWARHCMSCDWLLVKWVEVILYMCNFCLALLQGHNAVTCYYYSTSCTW